MTALNAHALLSAPPPADTPGAVRPGRPRVLIVVDYYTPGYLAGGPIRAVENLVAALGNELDFRIVTRDRDIGQANGYPGVQADHWVERGEARHFYVSPARLTARNLERVVRDTAPDIVYLNSFFSVLTLRLLVSRRLGRLPRRPVVLAPRGELAASALTHKPARKRLFLAAARWLRLYDGLLWQASSEHEADDIRAFLRRHGDVNAEVTLVRELAPPPGEQPAVTQPKVAGRLRAVFVSRIARVKNLDGALRALGRVRAPVELDVYGPREDAAYWAECSALIERLPTHVTVRYQGTLEPAAVPPVLAAHDVLFLPTRGENFGHVIVEALAAGCPALISDRTPWRNLQAQSAGWDVPPDDADAMVAALEALARMDAPTHDRLRQGARAFAATAASLSVALAEHRSMFARLLQASPTLPPDARRGSRPPAR